jgi:HK97 family phage portal protein
MGIVDLVFGNTISKRVSEQIASKQSSAFVNALQMINISLNDALPSINPDCIDYYQTFKTIGAVYEVTDLITKKVLNCPIVGYKIKDKAKLQRSKELFKTDPVQAHVLKMQAIEEVDISQLKTLLTNGFANPYQTGTQLMWTTILSYLLQGNTYVHPNRVGKKAKELWCFPNMEIAVDIDDLLDPIRGYILVNTNRTRFDIDEIQHIKTGTPAPFDRRMEYLYGVAPLRAYGEGLRAIKEGKTQVTKQAKNGGVFGILSPRDKEDQLTKDQKDQLKQKMIDARRSDDEMSRVFPSSISLAWQNIGLPIGDLKLLEVINASEEDVYKAYHVPLSYHNQKASTDNNVGTEVLKFIYDAIAPVCDVIGEAFTIMLGEGYGVDAIEWDYTQLPEMAVNMKSVAEYLKSLPAGVLTFNEMRAVLKYGEKTEAYMNEHYVNKNLTTLKRISEGTDIIQPPTIPDNTTQSGA